MAKNSHTQDHWNKVKEITHRPHENLALFLSQLMDAITKYTNLELNSPGGIIFLHFSFIRGSAPGIHKKLN